MPVTRLRLERHIREMSQDQVAEATGGRVPQFRISALERGTYPRPDESQILCELFELPHDVLFSQVVSSPRTQREIFPA